MKSHRLSVVQFLLIALGVSALVLAFAPAARVQQQDSTKVSTGNRVGLRIVTFDTIQGDVVVNLPDDMMAGDTISGTVIARPRGQSEEERAKNLAELSGYVIELKPPEGPKQQEVTKVPLSDLGASEIRYRLYLPSFGRSGNPPQPESKQGELKVSLKEIKQGTTGPPDFAPPQGSILIATNDLAPPTANTPTGGNEFKLPTIAQQGRQVEITGPFDGSFENTTVLVAGEEVSILAESPRKAVFQSPTDTTGPAEIVLREGKTETKGEYRNVRVKLSAPKTTLIKGESTTLKIEISGLQGIKETVPLHLVKGGVVTMEGGDVQTMSIKPAEVPDNGIFSTTRTITGEQAGGWNAAATVVIFDVCLQDDNSGHSLIFSSGTGDYIFCQGRSAPAGQNPIALSSFDFGGDFRGGVMVASGLIDSAGSSPGTISIGPGASLSKTGSVMLADFNLTAGHIHAQINNYAHSGTATVQMTKQNQTFTITDRDTRNNTCACK